MLPNVAQSLLSPILLKNYRNSLRIRNSIRFSQHKLKSKGRNEVKLYIFGNVVDRSKVIKHIRILNSEFSEGGYPRLWQLIYEVNICWKLQQKKIKIFQTGVAAEGLSSSILPFLLCRPESKNISVQNSAHTIWGPRSQYLSMLVKVTRPPISHNIP